MATRKAIKVIYVPRTDAQQISGGDINMMLQLKKQSRCHGVDIEIVSANELEHCSGADLLHLTQIYQLDAAETALEWARRKRMPVVVNPLFEEVLAMWFRWAIRRQAKWHHIARICGKRLAERMYSWWQTARRVQDSRWRRQRGLLQSAHVVPNTRYELQHLRKWFNLPTLDGVIVPLGVDADLFGAWQPGDAERLPPVLLDHRGRYILEVGVISMRKNQIGLLEALADPRDPIVFLGRSTPNEPDYHAEVRRLAEVRGNVIFIDYVEKETLPTIYGNAEMHVLPSWSERPGLVSLEAAACGCKVISSNRASIHEYLEEHAWYVDPAYPDQILAAIQQAKASAVPNGLRECALSYNWADTAVKLTQVYSTALAGNATRK